MSTEKTARLMSQLPGPKGLPVVGNFLQLDVQKMHSILEAWADLYGGLYKFRLFHKTIVAISDPVLIQSILRDRPKTYRRGGNIEQISRELGTHGVFAAEGTQWQQQRQLTMQAFKPEHLRRFFPTLQVITERLKNRWSQRVNAGQLIDVQNDWMRFTVDVTTNFAFGYDINLLEQSNDNFQRHLEKLLPAFNRRANTPLPYWHFVKLPSDRALDKSLVVINATIHSFIEQTRQRLALQTSASQLPANFLETLLLAKDEAGIPLSDADIQGNIITILLAGEDTTAHTLSWLVYLLTEHPDVQLKMQQEVDAVLRDEPYPLDMAVIDQLSYIEAVAHETMRLKSVSPLLFIEPNVDVELAGTYIPQGTLLMLVSRHGALQEANFTDALAFKPERWLDATLSTCVHNRQANVPFGAGARFCPGRNLAILEIKMAMAMLCKHFSVSGVEGAPPVQEVFSFTMVPDKVDIRFALRG
jgi:cytochrome P450